MTDATIIDELKALREMLSGIAEKHMDRQEVADRLGVHQTTLDRWVKAGSFPRPKNGKWLLSHVIQWERDR